jgi:hypothetical protein
MAAAAGMASDLGSRRCSGVKLPGTAWPKDSKPSVWRFRRAVSSRNPASAGFKRFRHRLEGLRIAMNDTCSKSG